MLNHPEGRSVDDLHQRAASTPAASPDQRPTVHGIGDDSTAGQVPGRAGESIPEEFGRYRILRKLGEGGMGAVYLARDTQLDREVALKLPSFSADRNSEIVRRFRREASTAATLLHPNICPVYDVGEIEGRHYLTMAYIRGHTLSEYIAPDKLQPERQVALLIRKLAIALHEAHQRGIVHRDLKPANIMIDDQREPIVMDFGLARHLDDDASQLTRTGTIVGTPAYMAPEQLRGEPVGPAADIYSLGVVLYQLLTGRVPFEGPPAAVIGQALTCEPPPIEDSRPDVSPHLAAICRRAMAKRPEERFASMSELAEAVGEHLRGSAPTTQNMSGLHTSVSASPNAAGAPLPTGQAASASGQIASFLQRLSRHPRVAVGTATAVVALGVLLGILVSMDTPDGTLVVEVHELGAVVRVLDAQGKVEIERQAETGTLIIAVDPGRHRLRVEKDGIEFYTLDFTVASGGREVISAQLLAQASEPRLESNASDGEAPISQSEKPPQGSFEILPIASKTVYVGEDDVVPVRIDRRGYEGPVVVRLEGIPGATATTTIPQGKKHGLIDLIVPTNAGEATWQPRVTASVAGGSLEMPLELSIHARPAVQPFVVPLNGLAEQESMAPMSFGPDRVGRNKSDPPTLWQSPGCLARLETGDCLAYPSLPVANYVMEVEVEFPRPGAKLRIAVGNPECDVDIGMFWREDRRKMEANLCIY